MSLANQQVNPEPHILEEFENYFVLFKPSGWFVHPPEDKRAQKAFQNRILTRWLFQKLGRKCFPVHRLDFATEGILIWAKNPEAAGSLSELNFHGEIEKIYHTVVRGFVEPVQGIINIPLVADSSVEEKPCLTEYKTLKQIELPVQINSSFPTSRYSLMEVRLHTGRWHQIRRHFNRISHPLIGDREHGDSHHNRFFRDELQMSGLLLKAVSLKFTDPWDQSDKAFSSPETPLWDKAYKLFN